MSRQMWEELIWWATADGTAIANTVTETVIFPTVTIPANYMADGRALAITASGRYSSTGTPTIRFVLRWGAVSTGALLWDSGTMTVGSGVTNAIWRLLLRVQTRANGASGSLFVGGEVIVGSGLAPTVGSATGAAAVAVGGSGGVTAPAAVTVDLTADTALTLAAIWGTASASNTLTGHNYHGESLN